MQRSDSPDMYYQRNNLEENVDRDIAEMAQSLLLLIAGTVATFRG